MSPYNAIHVRRATTIIEPDLSRVLLRPFTPGGSQRVGEDHRPDHGASGRQVGPLLDEISAEFSQRHQQIRKLFLERFEQVREMLPLG